MTATPTSATKKANHRRQAPLKIDPEIDELLTNGANFLGMSKKDVVAEAIPFYLDARREEMRQRMQALMAQLDGTRAAQVAMLAAITREELEQVGGVSEKD